MEMVVLLMGVAIRPTGLPVRGDLELQVLQSVTLRVPKRNGAVQPGAQVRQTWLRFFP